MTVSTRAMATRGRKLATKESIAAKEGEKMKDEEISPCREEDDDTEDFATESSCNSMDSDDVEFIDHNEPEEFSDEHDNEDYLIRSYGSDIAEDSVNSEESIGEDEVRGLVDMQQFEDIHESDWDLYEDYSGSDNDIND